MAACGGVSTCGTRGTIAADHGPTSGPEAAGSLKLPMPRRRTKRGAERTALGGDYDVIVCGASFAGLAVARELAARRRRARAAARPLRDRRAPDLGLRGAHRVAGRRSGSSGSIRQTFDELVMHTPHRTARFPLPWTFSTFDYPALCALLDAQNDAEFETATVDGRVRTRGRGA